MDKLVSLLNRPEETAAAAAAALGKVGGRTASASLDQTLAGASGALREAVADALLSCAAGFVVEGDRESADAIYAKLYRDASWPRRQAAALRGLAAVQGEKALPQILESLRADGSPRQHIAVELVRELAGQSATKEVAACLPKLSPVGQGLVLSALAQRGDKAALPAVEALCSSPDASVRLAALQAISALGSGSSIQLLAARTATGPADEREKARASLARLRGDDVNAAVISALQDADSSVKVELIKALGQRGATEAAATLLKTATSQEQTVRLASWRVLRDLGRFGDVPVLVDLLLKSEAGDRDEAEATAVTVSRLGADEAQRTSAVLSRLAGTLNVADQGSLLRVVGQIGGDKTKAVLQQLADNSPDATARKQAQEILGLIDKFGDYVTAWEVSPAYTKDDAMTQWLFDSPFAPGIPEEAKTVNWRVMPAGTNPDQPWLLDLLAFHGGEVRVAYLRTRVWSEKAQALVLELGSDDGIKVWLNHKVVHGNNVLRALEPAQDKVKVNLEQGWNQLLLKITQNNAGWGACARFRTSDGRAAEGLRIEVQ